MEFRSDFTTNQWESEIHKVWTFNIVCVVREWLLLTSPYVSIYYLWCRSCWWYVFVFFPLFIDYNFTLMMHMEWVDIMLEEMKFITHECVDFITNLPPLSKALYKRSFLFPPLAYIHTHSLSIMSWYKKKRRKKNICTRYNFPPVVSFLVLSVYEQQQQIHSLFTPHTSHLLGLFFFFASFFGTEDLYAMHFSLSSLVIFERFSSEFAQTYSCGDG